MPFGSAQDKSQGDGDRRNLKPEKGLGPPRGRDGQGRHCRLPTANCQLLLPLLLLLPLPLLLAASAPADSTTLFPLDSTAYLTGRYKPDTTTGFVRLSERLSGDQRHWLRAEATRDLERLVAAAEAQGVWLYVVSATRTHNRQRALWEARFDGSRTSMGRNLLELFPDEGQRCRALMRYSAPPGLSRHHWGTDVDLNSLSMAYWESPAGRKALDWLEAQAGEYGYVMAYPAGRRGAGPSYEPWHWSYAPLSQPLLRDFQRQVTDSEIKGFSGAEQVRRLDWRKFVFGVNESLK